LNNLWKYSRGTVVTFLQIEECQTRLVMMPAWGAGVPAFKSRRSHHHPFTYFLEDQQLRLHIFTS